MKKSNSSTPPDSSSSTKRKFACVECRQQKSKCDAIERSPLPCTKCSKKNIQCELKRDFKRTYKRARNEVIERTFKQLTQKLNVSKIDTINNNQSQINKSIWDNTNFTKENIEKPDFLNEIINTVTVIPSPMTNPSQPCIKLTLEQLKCTSKSLGDIQMSSEDISILFNEYSTNYHQYLPIVDLTKGPERIYTLSPCLFWVILLTGLRHCDQILTKYNDILNQLSSLVKSILSEITISPIIRYTPNENDEPLLNVASVYSVQAFLIYTFWPPLTSSLSANTSWNTIGTAMFQALRVGLNSADFSKEYATANRDLINEQRRTWICCNIVSQIIASTMGFPSYVSFDHSVLSFDENIQIPPEIKQMIQIAHFQNQIVKTMNSNPLNPSGMVEPHERFPLLQVLSQQLSQLEFQLNNSILPQIDDIRKFLLYVAKVHLQTYYFVISNDHQSNNIFETKRGLVQVYNSAINLLFHTKNMFDKDPNCIKFFPGCFILNIWQCACIIAKLIHSSLSDIIDCQRGKEAYNISIQLTLKASILKHDMAYRSSGIMRSIWSLFAIMHKEWLNKQKIRSIKDQTTTFDDEFNLNITVNSRMSVSVFFDCLYILKAKSGMAKLRRESGGLQQDDDDDDDADIEVEDEDESSKELSSINILEPELRARKIIEMIPLDPNPINARLSKPNSIVSRTTPDVTEPNMSQSLSSTNNVNTVDNNPKIAHSSSKATSPRLEGKDTSFPVDNEHSNREAPSKVSVNSNIDINTPISQAPREKSETQSDVLPQPAGSLHPEDQSKDTNHSPQITENNDEYNLISLDEPNLNEGSIMNTQSDTSPHSIIANFDNWDSEMVWKDVDILMNEFAFNPTV